MADRIKIRQSLTNRLSLRYRTPTTPEEHQVNNDELERFGRDLPWDVAWGEVASTQVSDGTQANIGTAVTAITQINPVLTKGRRYRITSVVNMYSPAGSANFVHTVQVLPPTAVAANLDVGEFRPSTIFGSYTLLVVYYEAVQNGIHNFLNYGQFNGAAGIILYDGTRYRRLMCEDMGPAGDGIGYG